MIMNRKLTILAILSPFFGGCETTKRLSHVENGPPVSQIENPTLMPNYERVSMPMPQPSRHVRPINSLWEIGSKTFFKDHRASRLGDIVMVKIGIDNEEAQMSVDTTVNPDNYIDKSLSNLFGFEKALIDNTLPKGVDKNSLVNTQSKSTFAGKGKHVRKDSMVFELAALISEILPNGNMVIVGDQEIRLGAEVRVIQIKGIIRREDISPQNSIASDKIQDLRIIHTGRGDISDATQTPWGTKILNKAMPF